MLSTRSLKFLGLQLVIQTLLSAASCRFPQTLPLRLSVSLKESFQVSAHPSELELWNRLYLVNGSLEQNM